MQLYYHYYNAAANEGETHFLLPGNLWIPPRDQSFSIRK